MAARAPVDAVIPREESPVDEVPPQRSVVVEEPADDHVDLLLFVPDAGLELEGDPLEHDPALRLLGRDLDEPSVPEERAKDAPLILARRAERQAGFPRGPDGLGDAPERLRIEP